MNGWDESSAAPVPLISVAKSVNDSVTNLTPIDIVQQRHGSVAAPRGSPPCRPISEADNLRGHTTYIIRVIISDMQEKSRSVWDAEWRLSFDDQKFGGQEQAAWAAQNPGTVSESSEREAYFGARESSQAFKAFWGFTPWWRWRVRWWPKMMAMKAYLLQKH